MQSPNPSSFKNFSKLKKNKGKNFFFFFVVIFLGTLGVVGVFLWNAQKKPPIAIQNPIVASLALDKIEEPKPQESYLAFEKGEEVEEDFSQYIEEEGADSLQENSDSELVYIFKEQEENHIPPFSDEALWKKNIQKPVIIPKGKRQVAVMIENMESLSSADWQTLHKIKIPLTFIFEMKNPKAPDVASKAWQKGGEVVIKLSSRQSISEAKNKFPRMIGVLSDQSKSASYLTISPVKGLVGGLPHQMFIFPVIRDKGLFLKSNRSILRVKPSKERIRRFVEWVSQNKKKLVFIPSSQLYPAEEQTKGKVLIDSSKIKEAYSHLA